MVGDAGAVSINIVGIGAIADKGADKERCPVITVHPRSRTCRIIVAITARITTIGRRMTSVFRVINKDPKILGSINLNRIGQINVKPTY